MEVEPNSHYQDSNTFNTFNTFNTLNNFSNFLQLQNITKSFLTKTNANSYEKLMLVKFFSQKISAQYIAIVPIMTYGLFLTYIIHISLLAQLNTRKVNKTTLYYKKRLSIALACYFFYQFYLVINKSSSLVNSGDLFVCLLIQLLEVFNSILTFFIVRLMTKKLFHIPYQNYFIFYWGFISGKIIYEIYCEYFYGLFFDFFTFSILGLLFSSAMTYLFYKYPRDDLYNLNSNQVRRELERYLPMISPGKFNHSDSARRRREMRERVHNLRSSDDFKMRKFKSINSDIIQTRNLEGKKSANSTFKANLLPNDISLDDISQNQPEILPLYPKIEITFKDYYKYYQSKSQKNLTKKTNIINANDDYFYPNSLPYSPEESIADNFYLKLIVKIKDMNINQVIKKSIQDFLNLQHDLKSEFTTDKYTKKICERLPTLKIPKNYHNIDFFKNYKYNFDIFLLNILSEPAFITDDVLNFLEIQDERLSFSYNLSRKKVLNIFYQGGNRIKDDTYFNEKDEENTANIVDKIKSNALSIRRNSKNLTGGLSKSSSTDKNLMNSANTPVNITPNYLGNNHNYFPPSIPTIKLNILEINKDLFPTKDFNTQFDFSIIIRISHSYMFKIVNKKLSEAMNMITEVSKINKMNENIKNLIKSYKSGDFYNESNFINKKFYSLFENVLQNIYDNLKMYTSNSVISEFFLDFKDDSISRCESFIGGNNTTKEMTNLSHTSNYFMQNPNSKNKSEKKDISYFYNLINSGEIVKVSVEVLNYMFLTIEFKAHVFYVTNIKMKLRNGETEEFKKKLKYKELNEFVNLMSVKLNLPIQSEKKVFKTADEKFHYRKDKLNKSLTQIFNHEKVLETRTWGDILERDRKYKLVKDTKHQRDLSRNKPAFVFKHRTESKESFLGLNIRDSIL